VSVAASNRSNDPRAKDDTRGQTAKDYIVRRDPDIRSVAKGRYEETEKLANRERRD
jgi:hypothetical protein